MRKMILSLACGVLLYGGFVFTNIQFEDTGLPPTASSVEVENV